MNIMIVNHYAGSPEMGMEFRHYYLGKYWVEAGHNVVVICASYSHLRRENPRVHNDIEERVINGITYIYIKTPQYSENDRRRTANIIKFVKTLGHYAASIAAHYKPDAVVASSTYPFDIFPASKLAKLSGASLIYEIHDLWPLSLEVLHGYNDKSMVIKAVKMAQKQAVKRADAVISILSEADRYLTEISLTPKKYYWIPNGIQTEPEKIINYPTRHTAIIQRYKEKGYFTVLYAGGFSQGNALDDFVKSAAKADADVMYILVGDGMDRVRLKRIASEMHIRNIIFLEGVSKQAVSLLLPLADCLYIGAKKSKLYSYGVGMNKLYDYLYSGTPVLCAVQGKANPVELSGGGIIIEPESPAAVADGISRIKSMSHDARCSMGEKGKEYVRKYHDYRGLAFRYLEILEETSKGKTIE
ncbi:MAG: glycosyltransferase family 4 protein [Oscillospiraceae bacterium]|nr:glycosyltransferase family 4 protein [Oscillospiraceae bacterium]